MELRPEDVNAFLSEGFPSASAGSRCEELGDGWAVARWTYDPSVLRPGGLISGPTQFALADLALYFAVFTKLGIEPMAVTSDLHISFLRSAAGGDLLARADLLKVGRSGIVGEIRLWVDGSPERIVSVAKGRYVAPSSS